MLASRLCCLPPRFVSACCLGDEQSSTQKLVDACAPPATSPCPGAMAPGGSLPRSTRAAPFALDDDARPLNDRRPPANYLSTTTMASSNRQRPPIGANQQPSSPHGGRSTDSGGGVANSPMRHRLGKRATLASTTAVAVPKPESKKISIGIFGGPRVGKTATASQFLWHVFTEEYKPTVEEFNWIEYDLMGAELMVQVIDLGGSNDFLAMRKLYAEKADAVLLVFAVDDARSFEQIKEIYHDLKTRNNKNAAILLLANKTDLFTDESQWAIDAAEITRFLQETKCPYTAISAKDEDLVQSVFRQLLQQVEIRLMGGGGDALVKRRQSMPVPMSTNGGGGLHDNGAGGRSLACTSLSPKDLARIRAAAQLAEDDDRKAKRTGSCKIS